MKKIATIAAIAAFATLAACSNENVDTPVDENAAAEVQLNEDGSVATEAATDEAGAEAAANEAAK